MFNFKKTGAFYLPKSLPSWAFLLLLVGYCVWAFIDIDKRSHSVSDTLINFAFNTGLVYLFYTLFAYFIVKKKAND